MESFLKQNMRMGNVNLQAVLCEIKTGRSPIVKLPWSVRNKKFCKQFILQTGAERPI